MVNLNCLKVVKATDFTNNTVFYEMYNNQFLKLYSPDQKINTLIFWFDCY